MSEYMRLRNIALNYIDDTIAKILEKWCKDINFNEPIFHKALSGRRIIVYSKLSPEALNDSEGKNIELLKNALKEEFGVDYEVEIR